MFSTAKNFCLMIVWSVAELISKKVKLFETTSERLVTAPNFSI